MAFVELHEMDSTGTDKRRLLCRNDRKWSRFVRRFHYLPECGYKKLSEVLCIYVCHNRAVR